MLDAGLGVGWVVHMIQLEKDETSTRPTPLPCPVAVQTVADMQDTADRLAPPLMFGIPEPVGPPVEYDQLLPFQYSASVAPAIGPTK